MTKTILSSKGQVIIPKSIRSAYNWSEGQELAVIDCDGGIMLKPIVPFNKTVIREVAGCLEYSGTPKTLEDMENAIIQGIKERHNDLC